MAGRSRVRKAGGSDVKGVDRYLQRLRIRAALPWIPWQAHVLDVGCADGALFRLGCDRIATGVGLDPVAGDGWGDDRYRQRVGEFPDQIRPGEQFDAVVMLAVVEHVSTVALQRWAVAIPGVLRPQGRVVITTPSPVVDRILDVGIRLRMLDGMEAEQHHGFDPRQVPDIFGVPGVVLEHCRRFEFGLNYLFVFRSTS